MTDPRVYGTISRGELVHVLRSDAGEDTHMPLIDERLASLHSAGTTVCQVHGPTACSL